MKQFIVGVVVGSVMVGVPALAASMPNLNAALGHLQQAKASVQMSLKEDKADLAGHRARAIADIGAAEKEIRAAEAVSAKTSGKGVPKKKGKK